MLIHNPSSKDDIYGIGLLKKLFFKHYSQLTNQKLNKTSAGGTSSDSLPTDQHPIGRDQPGAKLSEEQLAAQRECKSWPQKNLPQNNLKAPDIISNKNEITGFPKANEGIPGTNMVDVDYNKLQGKVPGNPSTGGGKEFGTMTDAYFPNSMPPGQETLLERAIQNKNENENQPFTPINVRVKKKNVKEKGSNVIRVQRGK